MPTPKEGWGGGEGEIVGDAAEMWARCAELGSRCAEIGARSHLRAERRRPLPGLRLPSPPLLSLLQQQRQKRALHALAPAALTPRGGGGGRSEARSQHTACPLAPRADLSAATAY